MVRDDETRNAITLICDLHKKDGATPIGKLTEPWKRVLNPHWSIWVNGQMTPQKAGTDNVANIGPGDVYVEFNGWPAGSFNMIRDQDEAIMCAGELANYSTFCDALENAEPVQ